MSPLHLKLCLLINFGPTLLACVFTCTQREGRTEGENILAGRGHHRVTESPKSMMRRTWDAFHESTAMRGSVQFAKVKSPTLRHRAWSLECK